jgi:hypothetical protein
MGTDSDREPSAEEADLMTLRCAYVRDFAEEDVVLVLVDTASIHALSKILREVWSSPTGFELDISSHLDVVWSGSVRLSLVTCATTCDLRHAKSRRTEDRIYWGLTRDLGQSFVADLDAAKNSPGAFHLYLENGVNDEPLRVSRGEYTDAIFERFLGPDASPLSRPEA